MSLIRYDRACHVVGLKRYGWARKSGISTACRAKVTEYFDAFCGNLFFSRMKDSLVRDVANSEQALKLLASITNLDQQIAAAVHDREDKFAISCRERLEGIFKEIEIEKSKLDGDEAGKTVRVRTAELTSELSNLKERLRTVDSDCEILKTQRGAFKQKALWAKEERDALDTVVRKCERRLKRSPNMSSIPEPVTPIDASDDYTPSIAKKSFDSEQYAKVISHRRQCLSKLLAARESQLNQPHVPVDPLLRSVYDRLCEMSLRPGVRLSYSEIQQFKNWLVEFIESNRSPYMSFLELNLFLSRCPSIWQ